MTQDSIVTQHPGKGLPPIEGGSAGTRGVLLEARHLSAHRRKTVGLFQDISLYIPSGELISIAGPSGSGKTSLLAVLAGVQPASEGQVQINDVSLYDYRKAFAPCIGFVPHQTTVYPELTVFEMLADTAPLRLPRGTKAKEQRKRVEEVIQLMDLQDQRDQRISALSPAFRQRVQIALELIAHPNLLLMDEPDEFLDPAAELALVELLRRLTRQGLTVIMVTRTPKAITLSDKVILLAPGGRLAWFGPPAEAIGYFEGFRAHSADPLDLFGFDDILAILASPEIGTPQDWAEQYIAQPAFKKYVDGPLSKKHPDLLLEDRPLSRLRGKASGPQPPPLIPQASTVEQFFVLFRRSLKCIIRDRRALALALVLPLCLALGELLLVSPNMYDPVAGDAAQATVITALLAFLAIVVAALAFVREIVNETGVYRRERQINLKLIPYVFSKVGLVVPIALYQSLVWTGMFFLAARIPAGPSALPGFYVTLTIAALVGCIIGLVASALANSVQAGVAWALVLLLPQLVLSGGILPFEKLNPAGKILAAGMPARYTFEALVTASGFGRDVAKDTCWSLPEDQRRSLTDAQKRPCPCMGTNILSQCNFPGILRLGSTAVNGPEPVQPNPDHAITAVPVQPSVQPGETLDQYVRDVNNYTLQLEIYQGSVGNYMNSLRQYLADLGNWQRQNGLAVGGAESLLASQVDAYGPIYNVNLVSQWLILLGMSLVLVVLLAGIQKGKGVA